MASKIFITSNGEKMCLVKNSKSAAGFDFSLTENVSLNPGQIKVSDLGFGLKMPPEFYATVEMRSSTIKTGLDIGHGIIDADYSGSIFVTLRNFTGNVLKIPKDEKTSSLIFS